MSRMADTARRKQLLVMRSQLQRFEMTQRFAELRRRTAAPKFISVLAGASRWRGLWTIGLSLLDRYPIVGPVFSSLGRRVSKPGWRGVLKWGSLALLALQAYRWSQAWREEGEDDAADRDLHDGQSSSPWDSRPVN